MAISLSLDFKGAKELKRQLRRVRRRGVHSAMKGAMDAAAKELKAELVRQWRGTMRVRRRGFPGNVLVIDRSFVDFATGRVKRPARVKNIGGDEALRAQYRGATRRPDRADNFLIPVSGRRKVRPGETYVWKNAIYRKAKRGQDQKVAVLSPQIRVPRRWPVDKAVARVRARFPAIVERRLRYEIQRALRGRR